MPGFVRSWSHRSLKQSNSKSQKLRIQVVHGDDNSGFHIAQSKSKSTHGSERLFSSANRTLSAAKIRAGAGPIRSAEKEDLLRLPNPLTGSRPQQVIFTFFRLQLAQYLLAPFLCPKSQRINDGRLKALDGAERAENRQGCQI